MTVEDIVIEHLKNNGYDGLFNIEADACGCSISDLAPCDEMSAECQPGYAIEGHCDDCKRSDHCESRGDYPKGGEKCVLIGPKVTEDPDKPLQAAASAQDAKDETEPKGDN